MEATTAHTSGSMEGEWMMKGRREGGAEKGRRERWRGGWRKRPWVQEGRVENTAISKLQLYYLPVPVRYWPVHKRCGCNEKGDKRTWTVRFKFTPIMSMDHNPLRQIPISHGLVESAHFTETVVTMQHCACTLTWGRHKQTQTSTNIRILDLVAFNPALNQAWYMVWLRKQSTIIYWCNPRGSCCRSNLWRHTFAGWNEEVRPLQEKSIFSVRHHLLVYCLIEEARSHGTSMLSGDS